MVLMFVFATFGVHLLGGKLWRCNDPDIGTDKVMYPHHIIIFLSFRPEKIWAKCAEPNQNVEEQSGQGIHCLQIGLHPF